MPYETDQNTQILYLAPRNQTSRVSRSYREMHPSHTHRGNRQTGQQDSRRLAGERISDHSRHSDQRYYYTETQQRRRRYYNENIYYLL